jgi:hypothetical protein
MPRAEVGKVGLDFFRCVCELRLFRAANGHARENVTTVVPRHNYERTESGESTNERSTRVNGRTVPSIGLEHLFNDEELSLPSRSTPCLGICGIRALGDILETPTPMIPDPIDFRVNFERLCRHS